MTSTRLVLTTLVLLGANSVQAQPRRPLIIADVQIGLPGGPEGQRRARLGAWVPVYVDLRTPGKDEYPDEWKGVGAGEFDLVVESSDGDSVGRFSVPAPALAPGERRTVITYYRPGNDSGELKLSLRDSRGSTSGEVVRQPTASAIITPEEPLYLALGGQFNGLRDALTPRRKVGEEEQDPNRVEKRLAVITRAADLPTRWIGYQGVEVVVLSTGNTLFLRQLLDPQSPAASALGEWVRRGGQLVLAVGRNHQEAQKLFQRLGLQAATLVKGESVSDLGEAANWVKPGDRNFPGSERIETARMRLKTGVLELASDRRGQESWPIFALAPLGTGRVFLIAFDLDAPAFSTWPLQNAFWQRLTEVMGPRVRAPGEARPELGTTLQRSLESFDEVPVISFGWVAFFILIYILIVGPLDYWFLKKVVKRLELTWVTFPLVVLVVSVAAYFTAYRIKGNHLRINKVDVVDMVLAENEVQGTTWFALFSPRVQAYTVGIDPVKEWGGEGEAEDRRGGGTVVTTLNAMDSSLGGVNRPTSTSLFRRPYQFAEEASGLRGVPVPVWASRSFTASWRRGIKADQLISADAHVSPDGLTLNVKIDNRLPVELTETSLFYQGKWYKPQSWRLPVGKHIHSFKIATEGTPTRQWMQDQFREVYSPRVAPPERGRKRWTGDLSGPSGTRVNGLMKDILFHGYEENAPAQNNSGLQELDQGWRLRVQKIGHEDRYLDEVLLVGRAVQAPAAAEEVSQDGVSPTRVWLGQLPGEEGGREKLPGFLGQDTYVRIYIPVSRSAKDQ